MVTSAPGAPHPVDEILCHFGQVIVDDVGDLLNVDSARSKVRRHKHAVASLLKPGQRRGALRL